MLKFSGPDGSTLPPAMVSLSQAVWKATPLADAARKGKGRRLTGWRTEPRPIAVRLALMLTLSRALFSALIVLFFSLPAMTAEARSPAPLEFAPEIEKEDYFRPGIAPVHAPRGYDVTIVYFMDYQCPSCRQYTPDVARVLAEDRRVRIIYRDTPIISDMSTVAARAAIASAFQGRHAAFHHALMMSKGRLTEAGIRAAAATAGVDWPRLQRDLKARGDDIDLQIGRNTELAVAVGVLGTPAFIIGDRQSNGALNYAALKAEIADARAAGGTARAEPAAVVPVAPIDNAPAAAQAKTPSPDADAQTDQRTAPPMFEAVPPAPTPAAARVSSPDQEAARLPLPLLAGIAVVILIGGGWIVQRRRATRRD